MVERKSPEKEIKKEEEEDLREIFSLESPEDIKNVTITRDGDQLSVKIPRDFAREIDIDPKNHHFRFTLLVDENNPNKKFLQGTIEENEEKKKDN